MFQALAKTALARLIYGRRAAVVPGRLQATWPQRMFLKRLLSDLRIDCVLDVGANAGFYGAELRRVGYRGHIISFEPDPVTFVRLQECTAGDTRWHAFNQALGSVTGVAEFNIMAVTLFNSFRRPSTAETSCFVGANEVVRTRIVDVARLDELLPELRQKYGFSRIFLKMDTQGYDLEVFAGAEGVRADILGLQSEIGLKRIYQDVPDWSHQISVYENAGFALAGIFAVNPGEPVIIEFDCYFRAES